MSTDLFTQEVYQPLASKRRPQSLSDFLGQQHILSQGKPLRETINSGLPHSMILWGPPGVGKTTLAKIIAQAADAHFESISAVLSGVKEIRAAISIAQQQRDAHGRKTLLFVDEVHRFNKSQQDAFLPYVEDGTVIFIGATTENPSFELNNALLSRCRIYVLKGLTLDDIKNIVTHSLPELNANNNSTLTIEEKALELLANAADGDARR
ncbi:MAG: AAA family ATPase, partial [Porticoccaceae bacterium]